MGRDAQHHGVHTCIRPGSPTGAQEEAGRTAHDSCPLESCTSISKDTWFPKLRVQASLLINQGNCFHIENL